MRNKRSTCEIFALVSILVFATGARANPIVVSGPFSYRDELSANDINVAKGDLINIGALSVLPDGSFGTTGVAVQGSTSVKLNFTDSDAGPHEFLSKINYSSTLTSSWNLTFTNNVNTPNSVTVATPSIGSAAAVPFVVNMAIKGSGTTPTFSWTPPGGNLFDGVKVKIWDVQNRVGTGGIDGTGVANLIHIATLPVGAISYTLPSVLSTGDILIDGHKYAVSIELDKLITPSLSDSGPNVLSRSRSFFDFTPINTVKPLFLPTDSNGGSYHFNIQVVGGQTVFLDPVVAIGYDFAIGDGDPNFASVSLPSVGDGLFSIFNCGGGALGTAQAGVAFTFAQGGLSCFQVRGIETSANLDPNNVTAFAAGLAFTADGTFNGSMTPITATVPEPSALILIGASLIGLAAFARRNPGSFRSVTKASS